MTTADQFPASTIAFLECVRLKTEPATISQTAVYIGYNPDTLSKTVPAARLEELGAIVKVPGKKSNANYWIAGPNIDAIIREQISIKKAIEKARIEKAPVIGIGNNKKAKITTPKNVVVQKLHSVPYQPLVDYQKFIDGTIRPGALDFKACKSVGMI